MKTRKVKSIKVISMAIGATLILIMAACSGDRDTSTGEKEHPSDSQIKVKTPHVDIHTATFMGDMDAIRQHIEAGSDLNEKEPTVGSSPLISAAVFGKTEVARALIEAGADVNQQNNEGSTALHSAAFLCRKEIVGMLLDNGADKELKNNFGSTALESVAAPFDAVKEIYDLFSKDLGPLGFKLDYEYVKVTRPRIAEMLR